MKKIYLCLLAVISVLSCAEKETEEIYQGKLEELIIGELTLKKDSLTRDFSNLKIVRDTADEYLIYSRFDPSSKKNVFSFFNPRTFKVEHEIKIDSEGPNSMKGGAHYLPVSLNNILAVNPQGHVGTYDPYGVKITELKNKLNQSDKIESMLRLETRKGLMYFQFPYLQVGQDPSFLSNISNLKKTSGPGELRSSFPLDFHSWLTRINLETGEIENSDFGIPEGYEIFEGDMTATQLVGAYDSKRDVFNLVWPYSEEIYVLKGLDLRKKIVPKSTFDFNFLPSEIIPWGDRFTVWALPKEASKNIFLLYDSLRDLYIKCSKINESGSGETKFERTKHYVLSIFSGNWEPKGEYFFDFEIELEVENWFLTSEGLFINKPEQASEDEYEFYKIDLSRFAD